MVLSVGYIKEKWQHAGFQKYLRNTGWMFFGRLFILLTSFFIGLFVARYLGPEKYGVINYTLSFVMLFSFLSNLGIDNLLVRNLVSDRQSESKIIGNSFFVKLIGGIFVVIATTFSSFLIKNDVYTTILVFLFSLNFIAVSLNVIDSYFQSVVEYKYIIISQISSTVFVSILKIFFVIMGLGAGWFVLSLTIESIINMLMLYFFFISKGKKIVLAIDTRYCLSLLKNAWPLAITTAFYVIYSKIDQVMIGHMLNNNQTGLYAAGVRLAEIWYFIPSMIMGIIFPSLVEAKKRNRDQFNLRIKKISFFILAISLAFSLIQFLSADFIVKILFGQKYTDSITVLQIYTWAISVLVLINLIQQYLTITNRLKTIMFASIFGATVNVLLNLYLIPIYGINGSAFATLISYFTIPIFIAIFNKKHED